MEQLNEGKKKYELRSERHNKEPELSLEKSVVKALEKMDELISEFKDEDFVLPTTILNDFSNPTREEINRELNRLPALMVYFSQEKANCQLLVDDKEQELDYRRALARERCKAEFDKEREKWLSDCYGQIDNACKSTFGAKLVPTLKTLIEKSKLSAPTEKDYEAYINKDQGVGIIRRDLNMYKSHLSRFTDMSYIINKRFQAVLDYSNNLKQVDIGDRQYARNS